MCFLCGTDIKHLCEKHCQLEEFIKLRLFKILKSARALCTAREVGAQQGRGQERGTSSAQELKRLNSIISFPAPLICPNFPVSYSTFFSASPSYLIASIKLANVSDNYSVVFVLVLNIKTVFKAVNVGFKIASSLALLLRDSTYDQLTAAVNEVLPAGANLIQISEGCVSLKVQVVNPSALETLWRLYQDGTLEASLQSLFVTDEMRELAGGEQVQAIVTIESQEYEKARNELAAFEAQGKGCFYLALHEP